MVHPKGEKTSFKMLRKVESLVWWRESKMSRLDKALYKTEMKTFIRPKTETKRSSGFPTTQKASFVRFLVLDVPPQNQRRSWSVYWQWCKETGRDVSDSTADGRQPEKKTTVKGKVPKGSCCILSQRKAAMEKKKKKDDVKADPNKREKKKRGERQRRRDKWRAGR